MSFSGLQSRLQTKKSSVSSAPTVEPLQYSNSGSIYTAAVSEVCADRANRKRHHSPPTPLEEALPSTAASPPQQPPQSSSALASASAPPHAHLSPPPANGSSLHDETEFLTRRRRAEEALLRCAVQPAPLPAPLCAFLQRLLQSPASFACASPAEVESAEEAFLHALCSAAPSPPQPAAPNAAETVLSSFWAALCWHWRTALREAWPFEAYLLSRRALPDAVRHTRGREAAAALEVWHQFCRVRRDVLEFMAYAWHDQKAAPEERVVPSEVMERLVRIVDHLQRREFPACRQLYVDLTMGTANWKLGLFSGGEVHMRRSMERIERRRIAHILHNEGAVRLLHALRELIDFVRGREREFKANGILFGDEKKNVSDEDVKK